MKQYWFILLSCLFIVSSHAQEKTTIIDDLNSTKVGQGSVRVYEDESIAGLIGSKSVSNGQATSSVNNSPEKNTDSSSATPHQTKPTAFKEATGYKIQVFSGNDQRNSKREGEYRKGQIQNAYPDMEATLTFNSPFWRLRVGNFRTHEEAFQTLQEMKTAFPAFGKEMQIVKTKIKIPIY